MNRRSTLKTLIIISAGAALLPSCLQDEQKSSISLKKIKIDGKDEALLSDVTETIIPKTNTPGAKDVSAYLFSLMMIDDCYAPAEQDKFIKGLHDFEEFSGKKFNRSFVKCTPSQKEEILQSVEDNKDITGNISFFYSTIKRLTVRAYTTSEYYLTKVHVYQLVPGKFYGCVPVKKAS